MGICNVKHSAESVKLESALEHLKKDKIRLQNEINEYNLAIAFANASTSFIAIQETATSLGKSVREDPRIAQQEYLKQISKIQSDIEESERMKGLYTFKVGLVHKTSKDPPAINKKLLNSEFFQKKLALKRLEDTFKEQSLTASKDKNNQEIESLQKEKQMLLSKTKNLREFQSKLQNLRRIRELRDELQIFNQEKEDRLLKLQARQQQSKEMKRLSLQVNNAEYLASLTTRIDSLKEDNERMRNKIFSGLFQD